MTAIEPPTPDVLLAHAGWVRGLARSLAVDASSAEDLVQDTWLAALRRGLRDERPHGSRSRCATTWSSATVSRPRGA